MSSAMHWISAALLSVLQCSCSTLQSTPPRALADATARQTPDKTSLISLADSVAPFRDRFNAHTDRPRFVAILSSTCGACVSGAVAVNEAILRGFKDADIDVHIAWIDVLRTDSIATAQRASTIFSDPRVTQYHDPNQLLGEAFAHGLVSRGPAWDIYLFYPADARWDERVPHSIEWMHQLGGDVADMDRFRTGKTLARDLHHAMRDLGFDTDSATPTKAQLATARHEATAHITSAPGSGTRSELAISEDSGGGRCERCQQSGSIGQCSISGWRYVAATREHDDDGNLSNRVLISGAAAPPVEPEGVDPHDKRHEYTIEGMNCPDCALSVIGAAFQVRGVSRVDVDYDGRRLIIYAHDDPIAKLDALPTQLGLAGYKVQPAEK